MKTNKLRLAIMAALSSGALATALPVVADFKDQGVTISPKVGYYFADSDRNLDDEVFYGIGLGYEFAGPWAIELSYVESELESELNGTDIDLEQIHLGATYSLASEDGVRPYLSFGIGQNDFDDNVFREETIATVGFGIDFAIADGFTWGADAKLVNSLDFEQTDYMFGLNLKYNFGASAPKVAASEPVVAAPAPVTVADDDQDGVPNDRDNCPNTEPNSQVDENGCYLMKDVVRSITLDINFANNSAEVTENYMSEIEAVAEFMRRYEQVSVEIEGHTDDRGAAEYNRGLSERRAQAVATILQQRFGISSSRLNAVGYGEANPIATNDTAEGRRANRRVVASIQVEEQERVQ